MFSRVGPNNLGRPLPLPVPASIIRSPAELTKKGMSIIERILETISNEEKIIRSISKRFSLDKYEDLWRRLHLGAEAYQAWRSQKLSDKWQKFGSEGSSQIH